MTQTAVSLTAMTTKPTFGKPEERTIMFTTTEQNVLSSRNLWNKSRPLVQQCSVGPLWNASRFDNTLPTFNTAVRPGNLQQKDKNNLADPYGSTDHPLNNRSPNRRYDSATLALYIAVLYPNN